MLIDHLSSSNQDLNYGGNELKDAIVEDLFTGKKG
jgi:hypothetical protein